MLVVNEIFSSFDGEVNLFGQGRRTVFLRLQGCNEKCPHCDSPASINKKDGFYCNEEVLVNLIDSYKCNKVTITGGEPLLQDILALVCDLKKKHYNISIETNGTLNPDPLLLKIVDSWIVDCKIYDKEWVSKFNFNIFSLEECDWIKFIIGNEDDFKTSVKVFNNWKLKKTKVNFAWSPIYEKLSYKEVMVLMDKYKINGNINIQLHKFIGVR